MKEIFVILFCFLTTYTFGQQLICENRKPEGHTSQKLNGDGGFVVEIFGPMANKGYYVPNEQYTVKIHGVKTRYSTQKFTDFLLVAESEKQATMGQSGLITTGIFHLVDDSLTRYSDFCPDGVTSTSLRPKSEVIFIWSAPSVLVANCITFKVVLIERPQFWFMDDGNLTKSFCPESYSTTTKPIAIKSPTNNNSSTSGQILPNKNSKFKGGGKNKNKNTVAPDDQECCACDEAKYQIIFEGIWSKETHPKDFPENVWLLHFSDIIGASHSNKYHMWKEGDFASEGIRHVAEWGSTRHMENELRDKKKEMNTIIKAKGLWHPEVNSQTSSTFRVDKLHNLVSLVSMVGPSPDWIVGISNFNLCLKSCTWLPETVINLYPYDAGTDDGISYMSPNTPSEPREKIRTLTPTYPNNPESPLYDPDDKKPPYKMKPFAKLTLRRHRIFPRECNETYEAPELLTIENTEAINRPECGVTEFTPWSDCSVSCGKGLRMRKRDYLIPMKAQMMNCDRQLVEKEMCLGAQPTCNNNNEQNQIQIEELDTLCAVTSWTEWTPCSVTCGKGVRSRSRRFKNYLGRKKCRIELSQSQTCTAQEMECPSNEHEEGNELELEDDDCRLTPWSEWSPCSVSCGKGFRERIRYIMAPVGEDGGVIDGEVVVDESCSSKPLTQRIPCISEIPDCTITPEEAKVICTYAPDPGPCRSFKIRYNFNQEKGLCTSFSYGGCKGNRNRFDDEAQCLKVCAPELDLVRKFEESLENITKTITTTASTTTIPSTEEPKTTMTTTITTTTEEITTKEPEITTTTTEKVTTEAQTEPPTTTTTTPEPTTTPSTTTTTTTIKTTSTTKATEPPHIELYTTLNPFDQRRPFDRFPSLKTESPFNYNNNWPLNSFDTIPQIEPINIEYVVPQRVDCIVSEWSDWSECTVSCGVGHTIRSRVIIVEPVNDGKKCPRRLKKRKICRMDPC